MATTVLPYQKTVIRDIEGLQNEPSYDSAQEPGSPLISVVDVPVPVSSGLVRKVLKEAMENGMTPQLDYNLINSIEGVTKVGNSCPVFFKDELPIDKKLLEGIAKQARTIVSVAKAEQQKKLDAAASQESYKLEKPVSKKPATLSASPKLLLKPVGYKKQTSYVNAQPVNISSSSDAGEEPPAIRKTKSLKTDKKSQSVAEPRVEKRQEEEEKEGYGKDEKNDKIQKNAKKQKSEKDEKIAKIEKKDKMYKMEEAQKVEKAKKDDRAEKKEAKKIAPPAAKSETYNLQSVQYTIQIKPREKRKEVPKLPETYPKTQPYQKETSGVYKPAEPPAPTYKLKAKKAPADAPTIIAPKQQTDKKAKTEPDKQHTEKKTKEKDAAPHDEGYQREMLDSIVNAFREKVRKEKAEKKKQKSEEPKMKK